MKRSAPATDTNEEPQATRRRQEPISCQVCRKKKLKCSRTFPCSNCVSRGLECQPPDVIHWSPGQDRSSSVAATNTDTSVLARVLERLQRLENIVLKSDDSTRNHVNDNTGAGAPSPLTTHEDVVQNELFHSIARSDASSLINSRHTEDEFKNTEISSSRPSNTIDGEQNFLFTTGGVSEITFDLNLKAPVLTKISVSGSRVIRRICLPEQKQAHVLFKTYASSIGSWYHIYHRHTVEALLDKVYHQIASGQRPNLAHVALLLSMFAGGAYFQAFAAETLFADPKEANQLALSWTHNTLDILDHVERASMPTSIEQLQATIIMSLMIQNFEGLSKKYWLLQSTSITLARDLSIHFLDHPARARSKNVIENEVKRRIWCFLATTDWLLGSMPSPQEGTYTINPRHCLVNRPMNVDDDDLARGGDIQNKPMSEPTEMSYFLIRTDGGEMCRGFADLVHPLASGVNNVDYDEIIALEDQTAKLVNDMPFYFQLDEESRRRTEPYLSKYPQLATQRYLLQQGLHCHRSRIHRPFLIRGSMDARFKFSREACLESVRKSLEIRRLLNQEKRGMVLPIARLNFVLYHVFMAALTLALDMCFNKSTSEAEDLSRRTELKEACMMLQESRTEMPAADRFLGPLMELLRKHKIQLQDAGSQNPYPTPSESAGTPNVQAGGMSLAVHDQDTATQVQSQQSNTDWTSSLAPELDFDGLWEEFINVVPDSNASGWDDLLADFNHASLFLGV
ncbi:hypothetical protein D6C90_02405 [Aureobasidium pullulans]|uniref:Zn(2)-C6 fungal-type domain-containing protein n=1 Tax=Aureobasidium pullulans TaxID=5580 RepID=A0A4V4KSM6_AURPU|nr:hypothetical protein D6C90_02405 [Aureobasidium pullulans]